MNNQIRLAAITDSPKITTGFGNVARMLLEHFHNSGFEVHSLGTMDSEMDVDGKLPYFFMPANLFDDNFEYMFNMFSIFLVNARPDVIFMMYDPGTLSSYLTVIEKLQELNFLKKVPIIVYTPIEGFPIPKAHIDFFIDIFNTLGRVILYSPGSVELVLKQYPDLVDTLDWAYHGLDHSDFRKYEAEKRNQIRKFVGLDDYFVVGSFGVNKRTKGFDQIIYTARCLKDSGKDNGIKFYLHTSATKPVLSGYNLREMALDYDVLDMIIFKPEQEKVAKEYVNGIPRIVDVEFDETSSIDNLSKIGFVDRLNMLDVYLDLSQVEGWGLPPHEAMRCGVPTISINDKSIRSEIYKSGAIMLDSMPFRMWNTWHNGVKLALVDPKDAAEAILELKNSDYAIKSYWSEVAISNANKFNWMPSCIKIEKIIKETLDEMSAL